MFCVAFERRNIIKKFAARKDISQSSLRQELHCLLPDYEGGKILAFFSAQSYLLEQIPVLVENDGSGNGGCGGIFIVLIYACMKVGEL